MIKSVTLALSLLTGIIVADEAVGHAAPTAALVAYQAALKKGHLDAAKDLTAKFKTLPAEALDQATAEYSAGAKAGRIVITPVPNSAKILGDFAVVTFAEGHKARPDYDPAYLMKQNGQWKVLLELTDWDHPLFDLSGDQKKQLGELKEWFRAEKKRLYARP